MSKVGKYDLERNAVRYMKPQRKAISWLLSRWKDGLSGVLQWSVQALVSLNSFVSDSGNGKWSRLIGSADNAKLRGAASALREQEKDSKS